ncbi:MAG: hypothetical protein PVG20_09915 [Thioalkalispiraceae bacterium]
MPNELDPRIDQWYAHIDKGQRFVVTAIDEANGTVETQQFNGDLEEFSMESWRSLDIEISEAPENWSGAFDIAEEDDLGTEVTDTSKDDWSEPADEIHFPKK